MSYRGPLSRYETALIQSGDTGRIHQWQRNVEAGRKAAETYKKRPSTQLKFTPHGHDLVVVERDGQGMDKLRFVVGTGWTSDTFGPIHEVDRVQAEKTYKRIWDEAAKPRNGWKFV